MTDIYEIMRDCDEESKKKIAELEAENERLKGKNANLRYALTLLRWEHAYNMETMIDLLYSERPSSWRFYYKSKTYWFNKWQELKEPLNG